MLGDCGDKNRESNKSRAQRSSRDHRGKRHRRGQRHWRTAGDHPWPTCVSAQESPWVKAYMCCCFYFFNCFLLTYSWCRASLVAQTVKKLLAMQKTQVRSLGREDPLEKEKMTHSSILTWRIPWTEKTGQLQSMGSQGVTHYWASNTNQLLFTIFFEFLHFGLACH